LEIFFKENRKSIALEAAEARIRIKLSSNRQKRDSHHKIGMVCRKKWEGIKDDIRNLADVGFPRIVLLFVIPWGFSCSGCQEDLDYFKEIIRKIAVSKMKADFVVSRFPDRRRYLEDFIDCPGIMAIGKIYYRRKDIR
jgi:protoheme ferro-lyase